MSWLGFVGGSAWSAAEAHAYLRDPTPLWRPTAPIIVGPAGAGGGGTNHAGAAEAAISATAEASARLARTGAAEAAIAATAAAAATRTRRVAAEAALSATGDAAGARGRRAQAEAAISALADATVAAIRAGAAEALIAFTASASSGSGTAHQGAAEAALSAVADAAAVRGRRVTAEAALSATADAAGARGRRAQAEAAISALADALVVATRAAAAQASISLTADAAASGAGTAHAAAAEASVAILAFAAAELGVAGGVVAGGAFWLSYPDDEDDVVQILQLIAAPVAEPVELAEAKQHLRVDGAAEDTLITTYLLAARAEIEEAIGRALMQQTWELRMRRFPPRSRPVRLPRPPVQSIVSVRLADLVGAETTLAASAYLLQAPTGPAAQRALLYPAPGEGWPMSQCERPDAVRIRFTSGYASAALVPAPIKAAILLRTGDLYTNREAASTRAVTENPTIRSLLASFVVPGFYRASLAELEEIGIGLAWGRN